MDAKEFFKEYNTGKVAGTMNVIDFAEAYHKHASSPPQTITDEEIEKKFPTCYPLRSTVNKYKQEGAKWVISQMRGLPKEGWISVEDKLPEVGQIVDILASRPYGHRTRGFKKNWRVADVQYRTVEEDGFDSPYSEFFKGGLNKKSYIVENGEVAHWQPLPKPPRTDNTQEITTKN